jgi:SAM-dependent methyltransferase
MSSDPFARWDAADDAAFYAMPRKVVHIEAGAIEALRSWYASRLPADARVLDLMSSWRSHLPHEVAPAVGLGMNAEEMHDNPQLGEVVVHDLNADPRLPFDDGSFDAVVCAVSVQYLIRPVEVFADVARVLRPHGLFAVSFSNRCFPTKAVAAWLNTTDADHRRLVRRYFELAGYSGITDEQPASPDDPLFVVWGTAGTGS